MDWIPVLVKKQGCIKGEGENVKCRLIKRQVKGKRGRKRKVDGERQGREGLYRWVSRDVVLEKTDRTEETQEQCGYATSNSS